MTDCKICFEYGLYYSPVFTPADFPLLSPIVLYQALKKARTELLESYLHFEIYAPQEYLSRAYHDAPWYCAYIVSTHIKNDEVILKGEIPARCISHGGRAYLENRPAENAGVFHKGDCPACAFDDWCHLCEVRPSAEIICGKFL